MGSFCLFLQSNKVGPCGGSGGSPWDDGVNAGIRQIILVRGVVIDSIRIEYDRDGSSVWSQMHGGSGGSITDKVIMQLDNI